MLRDLLSAIILNFMKKLVLEDETGISRHVAPWREVSNSLSPMHLKL